MIYNLFPLIIIVLSLAVVIVILIRKFPYLASLDLSTLAKERESEKKQEIIEKRLQRVLSRHKQRFTRFFRPIVVGLAKIFKNFYRWFYRAYKDAESKQIEQKKVLKEKREAKGDIITESLQEGADFITIKEYDKAEDKFIDIINLDKNNLKGYEGLVTVYLDKKEYEKAKETLKFILKLSHKLPDSKRPDETDLGNYHYQLGIVYKEGGDYLQALDNVKEALEHAPRNPKFLDMLVEVAIMHKDVKQARNALSKLKEVNPDNNKLDEFAQRIKEIG